MQVFAGRPRRHKTRPRTYETRVPSLSIVRNAIDGGSDAVRGPPRPPYLPLRSQKFLLLFSDTIFFSVLLGEDSEAAS